MASLPNLPGIAKLSPDDLLALVSTAIAIGVNPDWLATVMSFESGFSPSIHNAAGSGAVGLIQFMPSTARGLGTTTDALEQMSFQDQLEYVRKYFAPYAGRLQSLEDTYLAVFYPAFIGRADDAVLGTQGSAIYDQNAGFDADHKGYVTKSDITTRIRAQLAKANGRIDVPGAPDDSGPGPGSSGSFTKLGEVLVVLVLLGGVSWAVIHYTSWGQRESKRALAWAQREQRQVGAWARREERAIASTLRKARA